MAAKVSKAFIVYLFIFQAAFGAAIGGGRRATLYHPYTSPPAPTDADSLKAALEDFSFRLRGGEIASCRRDQARQDANEAIVQEIERRRQEARLVGPPSVARRSEPPSAEEDPSEQERAAELIAFYRENTPTVDALLAPGAAQNPLATLLSSEAEGNPLAALLALSQESPSATAALIEIYREQQRIAVLITFYRENTSTVDALLAPGAAQSPLAALLSPRNGENPLSTFIAIYQENPWAIATLMEIYQERQAQQQQEQDQQQQRAQRQQERQEREAFVLRTLGENFRDSFLVPIAEEPQRDQRTYSMELPTEEEASESGSEEESCLSKGLIEEVAEAHRQKVEEDDDWVPKPLSPTDARLGALHARGLVLLASLSRLLNDASLDDAAKSELLRLYLDAVPLAIRQLVVVSRSYLPEEDDGSRFFTDLMPQIPQSMSEASPRLKPIYRIVDDTAGARVEFAFPAIFGDDIRTLLRAPSPRNYVQALKYGAVLMMLQQIDLYGEILGTTDENAGTPVPAVCQDHLSLPFTQGRFNPPRGDGDPEQRRRDLTETLLVDHALIFEGGGVSNYDTRQYYFENADRDPLRLGSLKTAPFETYSNSKEGLRRRYATSPEAWADIDDIFFFDKIMELKRDEAVSVFQNRSALSVISALFGGGPDIYTGFDLFQKIISAPPEGAEYQVETTDENGRTGTETIYTDRMKYSVYLIELMLEKGVGWYEDALSENLKNRMKNTRVTISMPPLYGPSVWRQWAIERLQEFASEAHRLPPDTATADAVAEACGLPDLSGYSQGLCEGAQDLAEQGIEHDKPHLCLLYPAVDRFCKDRLPHETLAAVGDFLGEFSFEKTYVPVRRIDEERLALYYPFMKKLWDALAAASPYFEAAHTNEYDLITTEMRSNPWAPLRLGYLAALDEIEGFRFAHQPILDQYSYEFHHNLDSIVSKIKEAAAVLGIDRPLTNNYANGMLTRAEKIGLWEGFVKEGDEENASLFAAQVAGREAYEILTDISFETLLTRADTDTLIERMGIGSLVDIEARNDLAQVAESEEARLGGFLLELYEAKGDPQAQQRLVEDFLSENPEEDLNEYTAKDALLSADFAFKKPLYSSILRRAASQKRDEFLSSLEDMCAMNHTDHEGLRALFYSTIKVQEGINSAGNFRDGVPQDVLDKVGEMPPEEWAILGWMGVMMGSMLGIGFSGALCTGLPAGCPAIAASLMALGPTAAYAQWKAIVLENKMLGDGRFFEPKVQRFEDIGITGDYEKADALFSKDASWQVKRLPVWLAIEAGFAPNVLGFLGRGLNYGARFSAKSLQLARAGASKAEWAQGYREVLEIAETRLASYVLFPRGATGSALARGSGGAAQTAAEPFLGRLRRRAADFLRPFDPGLGGETIVAQSVEEIDAATARRVADYFRNDPEYMLRRVKSYAGDRLKKAEESIAAVNRRKDIRQTLPNLRYYLRGDGFRNWWSSHLSSNGAKLRTLTDDMERFAREGDGDVEGFILEHIEEMTSIYVDIAMRKREILYMATLQGAYYYAIPYIRRSPPFLGAISDGIIVRQFFQSRARLVYESLKRQAREELGLASAISDQSQIQTIRAFQENVEQTMRSHLRAQELPDTALMRIGSGKLQRIQRGYALFQARATREVAEQLGLEADEKLMRLLFSPEDVRDLARSDAYWEAIDIERLLNTRRFEGLAHDVALELADFDNPDEFMRLFSALRILNVKREVKPVDVL